MDKIKTKRILIFLALAILVIGRISLIFLTIDFVSAVPPCQGEPEPCAGKSQYWCNICGCDWLAASKNFWVNVGDVWRKAQQVSVNVGDVWRPAIYSYINVGDVWRSLISPAGCGGSPTACSYHSEMGDCEGCGCFWTGGEPEP